MSHKNVRINYYQLEKNTILCELQNFIEKFDFKENLIEISVVRMSKHLKEIMVFRSSISIALYVL